MTHSEIEAFFEIIKAGSISTAANNLFVSQPALTRRIQTLESELGYSLFQRKKGKKKIELTQQGNAFISIANRWKDLWQEALDLKELEHLALLKLSAINSMTTYVLPEVFRALSNEPENIQICFKHCHSSEAYDYVANGSIDLALISDVRYDPNLETIPLFQEPMILLSNHEASYPKKVSPDILDPYQEIYLPWNPEYQSWHDYWFGSNLRYRAYTDQMKLLEDFLSWKGTWAIAPISVAGPVSHLPYVKTHELETAPSDRIIYYVKKVNREIRFEELFLNLLQNELKKYPVIPLTSSFQRNRYSDLLK